jgi:hypothetical protein
MNQTYQLRVHTVLTHTRSGLFCFYLSLLIEESHVRLLPLHFFSATTKTLVGLHERRYVIIIA